jgi:hypothetical protein
MAGVPLLEQNIYNLRCLVSQVAVRLAESKVLAAEIAGKLQKGEHAIEVTTPPLPVRTQATGMLHQALFLSGHQTSRGHCELYLPGLFQSCLLGQVAWHVG